MAKNRSIDCHSCWVIKVKAAGDWKVLAEAHLSTIFIHQQRCSDFFQILFSVSVDPTASFLWTWGARRVRNQWQVPKRRVVSGIKVVGFLFFGCIWMASGCKDLSRVFLDSAIAQKSFPGACSCCLLGGTASWGRTCSGSDTEWHCEPLFCFVWTIVVCGGNVLFEEYDVDYVIMFSCLPCVGDLACLCVSDNFMELEWICCSVWRRSTGPSLHDPRFDLGPLIFRLWGAGSSYIGCRFMSFPQHYCILHCVSVLLVLSIG